jgi:hypothetical protein
MQIFPLEKNYASIYYCKKVKKCCKYLLELGKKIFEFELLHSTVSYESEPGSFVSLAF